MYLKFAHFQNYKSYAICKHKKIQAYQFTTKKQHEDLIEMQFTMLIFCRKNTNVNPIVGVYKKSFSVLVAQVFFPWHRKDTDKKWAIPQPWDNKFTNLISKILIVGNKFY